MKIESAPKTPPSRINPAVNSAPSSATPSFSPSKTVQTRLDALATPLKSFGANKVGGAETKGKGNLMGWVQKAAAGEPIRHGPRRRLELTIADNDDDDEGEVQEQK